MLSRANTTATIFRLSTLPSIAFATALTAVCLVAVYVIQIKAGVVAFQLPLAAVALSSLFGGARGGILSTIVSTVGLVFISAPIGSVIMADQYNEVLRLGIFILCSVVILWTVRRVRAESFNAMKNSTRLIDFVDHLDHSIVWDARASDLTCSFIAKRVEGLLGYTENEWISMGAKVWENLVPPEDLPRLMAVLDRIRSGHPKEGRCDHRFITKEGKERWFQTGAYLKDEPNRERQLYGVSVEITPLKQAELQLETLKLSAEASERRLASVLDTAQDAIVTIDDKGKITGWNFAAQNLFSYDRSEVLGKNVSMLMPEPYRHEHDSYISSYKDTGINKIIGTGREVTGRRKDGSTFPMDLAVSEFRSDSKRNFTGIIRDITERKTTEAALRKSEARFRVALENAPIEVYSCDTELRYTWAYGVPEYLKDIDIIGKRDDEIVPLEDARPMIELKFKALSTGRTHREMIQMKCGGREFIYDVIAEPDRDDSGIVTGLTVAVLDITDIAQAKQKAEEASQAKTNFLSNISHEIRTPIGIVQGFAEILLETEERAETRQMLSTIVRNTKQLTSIIGEVLDVSKIEANQLEMESIEFPLLELIDDVRNLLAFSAEQKGILFRTIMEGDLPTYLISDPTRLKQILINLGANAIKFTPEGEVNMTFRCTDCPRGPSKSLEVVVRDTGIGMKPQDQERIFAPFVQGDSSTTRRYGGTGLGLFISRRLARELGGDIELVHSTPGGGSEFLLRISIEESYALMGSRKILTPDTDKPIGHRLKDIKILLAEDSLDNQQLVTRILQRQDAKVDIAHNGNEALEKVRSGDYDIILMDIQMPELDGFEAMKKLRQDGHRGPIVALTAHSLAAERERALRSGFDAYVTKPINRNELIDTIRRFQEYH